MSRDIDDLDFNSLRSKIIETIGTGSGSYGYGQEIQSSSVFEGNLITKNQWDGLRNDLINILIHQTGVTPDVIEIIKGQQVRLSDPFESYTNLIETARNNRFDLAPSQSIVTSIATKTYTSQWNTYAYTNVRLTFVDSNQARYFFNSGSKIRFSSSRSGGSSTAQNTSWTNSLNSAGTIEFSATSNGVSFYQLTNSYQTLYETGLSTPYSSNRYRIRVLSNVANNTTGTANTITFEINWLDNYSESFPNNVVDPPDRVDGTLSLTVEEVKATGQLQPSGTFSITSPAYSVEDIAAGYEAPPPPPVVYPPPSPPPVVTYNEIVTVPSSVAQYETFSGTITGGAPNTSFSIEWRYNGNITSSGSATLDGSGNYNSGSIGVFVTPGTYTLTVRFNYTGNVVVKTTTVIATAVQERITVPASVNIGDSFLVSITGGVPGTGFSVQIYNNAGGTILINPLIYLDASGNFSTSLPAGVVPADTYTWKFNFFQGSGNIYYKTTVVKAPCVNPPDTQDSIAVYQTGMVLRYSKGSVSGGNTLVKSTKTSNAATVNTWYQAVLGRPGDPEGMNFWTGRLNAGELAINVYLAFVSAANVGELSDKGKVTTIYTYCEYNG